MPLFKPQLRVDDEGVLQGYVGEMDFVGAGVAVVVVGNIATVTIAGGGNTIYSGDGTIAGARAVALNSNAVAFNQGAEPFFKIDPTANAETTFIRAFNTTGSDNYGRVVTSTSATNGQAFLEASFNGGAKIGGITVIADATSARCTYIALTHIFTGGVSLVNDIDVATAGTRWGSQSFAASGEFPACALIGSYSGSVTIFPSYSSVTVGSKVIIGYWSGAVRSAFEVANVASGNGVAYIMKTGGNVGIGVAATTARLHLPAGSATASTGPLKFTSGTLLGTTEAGAIEFDGTHLYFTAANAGTRYQLDQQGGGATIYSGDGTIASDRTVDLGGHTLSFNQGSSTFLYLEGTPGSEIARLFARNTTAGGNVGGVSGTTSNVEARFDALASFDNDDNIVNISAFTSSTEATGSFGGSFGSGSKYFQIDGTADATTSTIVYTADQHTFNIPLSTGIFKVTDSGNNLINVDVPNVETTIKANDGTANSFVRVRGAAASALFTLDADNGSGSNVGIEGDAGAESITYTAGIHTFNIPAATADATFGVTDGSNYQLLVDATPGSESSIIVAYNITDGGNSGGFFGTTSDNEGSAELVAEFDGGAKSAIIAATANATTATLTYTADTHTFNIPAGGIFSVNNGVLDLVLMNGTDFQSQLNASDNTAISQLDVRGDLVGTDVYFSLLSDDGTNQVEIRGEPIAQTITLTSATTIVSNLAGTGSRAVLADATGTLSAPISDFSVKENVMDLTYGLDILSKLRPVSFMFKDDWKRYGEGMQIGFIAQEIESILPNSVFTTPSNGKMGFNSDDLIAVLVKSVQDQQAHIERLEKQISMN